MTNQRRALGSVDGGRKRATVPSKLTWEKIPPSTTTRSSSSGSTRRYGDRHSDSCISCLTLTSRPEQTHKSLQHLPRPPGRRPLHQEGWTNPRRPQETFLPLHHDQLLPSTFHHRPVKHHRGSSRTWRRTRYNPYHQHPRAMRQDSSSHRFLQPDLALKRRRKTFAVDTSTSSNNQIRHHPHRRRSVLHFQSHWIFSNHSSKASILDLFFLVSMLLSPAFCLQWELSLSSFIRFT